MALTCLEVDGHRGAEQAEKIGHFRAHPGPETILRAQTQPHEAGQERICGVALGEAANPPFAEDFLGVDRPVFGAGDASPNRTVSEVVPRRTELAALLLSLRLPLNEEMSG